jgi:hypothetical protein
MFLSCIVGLVVADSPLTQVTRVRFPVKTWLFFNLFVLIAFLSVNGQILKFPYRIVGLVEQHLHPMEAVQVRIPVTTSLIFNFWF